MSDDLTVSDTTTSTDSEIQSYLDDEVMPYIEESMFSEAVNMYKANQRMASWIKQMEDESAKS